MINEFTVKIQYDKLYLKVSVQSLMHFSTVNLPLFYIYDIFFCSSVHGFVRTTDFMIDEGATQEVITMMMDVKGETRLEPPSTRVLNIGFSFTCIDSSNGGDSQAVGEFGCVLGEPLHFTSMPL